MCITLKCYLKAGFNFVFLVRFDIVLWDIKECFASYFKVKSGFIVKRAYTKRA